MTSFAIAKSATVNAAKARLRAGQPGPAPLRSKGHRAGRTGIAPGQGQELSQIQHGHAVPAAVGGGGKAPLELVYGA